VGRRFGFIGNVPFINNKKNEKAKNEQNGRDLYAGQSISGKLRKEG
jgi:hypothetical protein